MVEWRTPEPSSPRQNPTPCTPEQQRRPARSTHELLDAPAVALDQEFEGWEALTAAHIGALPDDQTRQILTGALARIKSLRFDLRVAQASTQTFRLRLFMLNSSIDESQRRQGVEDELAQTERNLLLGRLEHQMEHVGLEDEAALFRSRHRKAKRRCMELAEINNRQSFEISHLQAQLLEQQQSRGAGNSNGHGVGGSSSHTGPRPMSEPRGHRPRHELGLDVLSNAASAVEMESSQHSLDSHQDALLTRPSTGLMTPIQYRNSNIHGFTSGSSIDARPHSSGSGMSHMRGMETEGNDRKRKLAGSPDQEHDADRDTASDRSLFRGAVFPLTTPRPDLADLGFAARPAAGMRVRDLLATEAPMERVPFGMRQETPPTPGESPPRRRTLLPAFEP